MAFRVLNAGSSITVAIFLALLSYLAADAQEQGEFVYTNRLIDTADPYLLLHAHNPVDWYPWGQEALTKAKHDNRPIFLSVGYSTCYWCHVAERTIYSNPDIAKLMNQWFVNIKVDREQLPDIDRTYMLATEVMTGGGGWPNNLFLTPDLKPFFSGSYFPPETFKRILSSINQQWSNNPSRVEASADKVITIMRQVESESTRAGPKPFVAGDSMDHASTKFLMRLDDKYGGMLSGESKFPEEPGISLMLADYRLHREPKVGRWITVTLNGMAYGGVWDQLGNGFYRYSTDRTWSIPHFEKMLYDNAQLLLIYAEAYGEFSDPFYRRVATAIAQYLEQQMMAPEGGFFTAKDSEVGGIEGASYVWTHGQIESALGGKDAVKFFQVYELTPLPPEGPERPAPPAGAGVIRLRIPIADAVKRTGSKDVISLLKALAPMRARLLLAREGRAQPARDEKIVVGLNGLAIQALSESSRILDEPENLALARRAAERIWLLAWDPKTSALQHEIFEGRAQTQGYLDDYALLGIGFEALHETTGDKTYQGRAMELADSMLAKFTRDNGAMVSSAREQTLGVALEDTADDVYPSGTSAAIELLLKLAASTDKKHYASAASRVLEHLSGSLHEQPERWPALIAAANLYLPEKGVTVGEAFGTKPLEAVGNKGFRPPDTADHVHAAASIKLGKEPTTIEVTLKIDEGYHINSNPASIDYLIPTSVSFDNLKPSQIQYPKPRPYTPSFAGRSIGVYDGVATIAASFPSGVVKAAQRVTGNVTAQACNDQVCLPAASLPVAVTVQ